MNVATAARFHGTAHSPHVAWTPHPPPPPPPPSFQVHSLPRPLLLPRSQGVLQSRAQRGRVCPSQERSCTERKTNTGRQRAGGAPTTSDRNTRTSSSSGQADTSGSTGTRESPAGTKSSSLTSSQGPGARKKSRESLTEHLCRHTSTFTTKPRVGGLAVSEFPGPPQGRCRKCWDSGSTSTDAPTETTDTHLPNTHGHGGGHGSLPQETSELTMAPQSPGNPSQAATSCRQGLAASVPVPSGSSGALGGGKNSRTKARGGTPMRGDPGPRGLQTSQTHLR